MNINACKKKKKKKKRSFFFFNFAIISHCLHVGHESLKVEYMYDCFKKKNSNIFFSSDIKPDC